MIIENIETIYTDGGLVGSNPAKAGTYAFKLLDIFDKQLLFQSGPVLPKDSTDYDYFKKSKIFYTQVESVTNNVTELAAVLAALNYTPDGWDGTIFTDSKVTLCRLISLQEKVRLLREKGIEKIYAFEGDKMFKNFVGVPQDMRILTLDTVCRLGKFSVYILDGHPTQQQLKEGKGKRGQNVSIHNVECDSACTQVANALKNLIKAKEQDIISDGE